MISAGPWSAQAVMNLRPCINLQEACVFTVTCEKNCATAGLKSVWNECERMGPSRTLSFAEVPYFGFELDAPARDFLSRLGAASLNVGAINGDAVLASLRAQRAWSFGLVVLDVGAWRTREITETYENWIRASAAHALFPVGSLAHGRGLAYLALCDNNNNNNVQCWEDHALLDGQPAPPIVQGLGFISPADLGGLDLEDSFALHFNGDHKP